MKSFLMGLTLLSGFSAFASTDFHWVTPDFFVGTKAVTKTKSNFKENENCRKKIAQVVCLVTGELGDNNSQRPCLAGSETYAKPFEDIYDVLPTSFQKMFCSLDRIYIETELKSSGYGGTDHATFGTVVGVRKTILDANLDFTTWASWKEQIMFGESASIYDPKPYLPMTVYLNQPTTLNTFLFQFLVHEFGHIFDHVNDLNRTENCQEGTSDKAGECDLAQNSWGSINWQTTYVIKDEFKFSTRDSLCFYWCKGNTIPYSIIPKVYQELYASPFISAYTTTNPYDDFADSLAYYSIAHYLGGKVELQDGQGTTYDLTGKISSPIFQAKLKYIEDFLVRTDIVYP